MIWRSNHFFRNVVALLGAQSLFILIYLLLSLSRFFVPIPIGTILAWLLVLPSLVLTLFVLHLAAPVFVRLLFECKPLNDAQVRTLLDQCFSRANLTPPVYWIVSSDRVGQHNLMVAGGRRGLFQSGLFIASDLSERLSTDELEALVLHEVGHLKLRHGKKRLLRLFGFLGLSALFILAVAAVSLVFLTGPLLFFGMVGGYFLGLPIQQRLVSRTLKNQEFEADLYAVNALGADKDVFIAALKKLHPINGDPRGSTFTHPSLESRIALLESELPILDVGLLGSPKKLSLFGKR